MPEHKADPDQSQSRTFIMLDGLLTPTDPEAKAAPAEVLAPGAVIDSKYKVLSLLGQGGMGAVYLVHHQALDKEMALKTYRSRQIEKDAAQRFELEARAIAKLSHKNIVQVYDFGFNEGKPYYTMELLSGATLVKYIDERKLSLRETLEIFIEVADGLAHAHKAGIIHRDIKPDNIYLGPPKGKAGKISSVKIVDFGIAKLAMEGTIDDPNISEKDKDQARTRVGRVFGSPLYMSPEQSTGMLTDHTTDIYSFGCTLFEAITGRPPFVGENSRATLALHRMEKPPTLAQMAPDHAFPQRLEGLIARLLKKEKGERIQSCFEIRQELARILALLADSKGLTTSSIATQKNSGQRSFVRQAKTDPLIAADRAFSRVMEERPRAVIAAASVALSAVLALSLWSAWTVAHLDSDGKNKRTALASSQSTATRTAIELPSAIQTARPIESQPPPPFLIEQTKTSKTYRFPPREPIGELHYDRVLVPAMDVVEVPRESECHLEADRPIALRPAVLGGFGPDDLQELSFGRIYTWGDEHIKWAGRLTGLTSLDVGNCDITDVSIDYLNNLAGLKKINISGAKISAIEWCRLRQLSQLKTLKIEEMKNTLSLLSRLKQNNNLEDLEFQDTDISDVGMTYVTTFKKLERLRLVNSTVTTKGLKDLHTLPKLHFLCLAQCHIGPESMPILLALPALRELEIETDKWGLRNQALLEHAMRAKHVVIKQTTPHGRNN
jgi:serine/threonine-protein kinase